MILFGLFCCLLVFVLAEKKELCFAEDIPDLLAQLGKFANKIFPLLNLLRGFKKSRGLAGWRWYQCKQCFELRRGRSQPCYC
ncbi:hypothetical protein IMY05_004G0067500 [Salix suchowensis]|nr:hypothetical protein IMY05_004G0067500 [Salix suchowensis]